MTWDDLLAMLVGFVGRRVHAQVWNTADPDSHGAVVVSTRFGSLTRADPRFDAAMSADIVLLTLDGRNGEKNGVLSLSREEFVSADRIDDDRLEIVLGRARGTGPRASRPSGLGQRGAPACPLGRLLHHCSTGGPGTRNAPEHPGASRYRGARI